MTAPASHPPLVSVLACRSYDRKALRAKIASLLEPLGGMERFVPRSGRVLLKPNLLAPASPDGVVCSHPAFVLAVADLVSDCGAKVLIGDSPALVKATAVARRLGLLDEAARSGYEVVDFREVLQVDGPNFRSLEIARDVLEADAVINLPRFKTHGMMVLTLAVKNLFGCVVGKRKGAHHLAARDSREVFARLLVDVAEVVSPALSILDAVVAMEGNGPQSGTPRELGFIAASAVPWALDLAGAWVTGYVPAGVPVLKEYAGRLAKERKILDIRTVVDPLEDFAVSDFERAETFSLSFSIPAWIRRPLARLVLPSPALLKDRCVSCGNCAEACPPGVIEMRGGRPRIDLSGCIRCFCCAEVCPVEAMVIRKPPLAFLRR